MPQPPRGPPGAAQRGTLDPRSASVAATPRAHRVMEFRRTAQPLEIADVAPARPWQTIGQRDGRTAIAGATVIVGPTQLTTASLHADRALPAIRPLRDRQAIDQLIAFGPGNAGQVATMPVVELQVQPEIGVAGVPRHDLAHVVALVALAGDETVLEMAAVAPGQR